MAFYGLAHAPHAYRYMSQFVALSPCFVGDFSDYYATPHDSVYTLLASALEIFDIESLFGPEWQSQLEVLCTLIGDDSEECILLRGLELGPVHDSGNALGYQEVGVKQALHYAQNALEDRFQEFANYYIFGSWF